MNSLNDGNVALISTFAAPAPGQKRSFASDGFPARQ
jgi:hypothetical protein